MSSVTSLARLKMHRLIVSIAERLTSELPRTKMDSPFAQSLIETSCFAFSQHAAIGSKNSIFDWIVDIRFAAMRSS